MQLRSSLSRRVTRFALPALLGLLAFQGTGCSLAGLFYRHQYRADRFVIYSDHDPEFLARIGPEVEQIYEGYGRLFQVEARNLGRTCIILQGEPRDQQVVDLAYSPSLLGYYIPFFNMISVDTKPVWAREKPMLEQILLHEVAHHFIVTQYPEAGKECWLNEGLAGAFEVTLFEDRRFEYHLLNPTLLGIARRAALIDSPSLSLKKLLSLDWGQFHRGDDKDLDYALSWAIVYYLLDHHLRDQGSLHDRIQLLYHMDREEIARLEPQFLDFLRTFDLTGTLIQLSQVPGDPSGAKLTPRWAVYQLGSLRFLDDSRALCALEGLLDAPDQELAAQARLAFLKALERGPDAAHRCSTYARGRDRIISLVLDPAQPLAVRQALVGAISSLPLPRVDPSWVPVLIALLDASEGELRAAAAAGLSGAEMKPTIANPAFWRDGSLALRKEEVEEWRSWWESHQERLTVMD
jgi:hypothetical protein